MKAISISLMVLLLTGPLVAAAGDPAPKTGSNGTINLDLGGQKEVSLTFKGATKVSIGNPSVADVEPQGEDTMRLFATGPGTTSMIVVREGKPNLTFVIVVEKNSARNLDF